MQISREQLVFTFAVGGSGQSEHFAGDPREYKKLIPSVSIQEVEKKIKAAVYLTKAKQGKSDIWKQFSFVNGKNEKERIAVLSKFTRFILSILTF